VPLRPEEAWAEIAGQTGARFDPLALLAVQQAVGVYPPGTLVLLTTGEAALVLAPPPSPQAALRPPVFLVRDADGRPLDGPALDLAASEGAEPARDIAHSLDPSAEGIWPAVYLLPSWATGGRSAEAGQS